MAGLFPAMGNPAAGANAAAGLGNQLLGFLSNLPQQLEQWEQLKQQRQDNAYKQFQVLSQLATTAPGITQDPRFARSLGMTAKQLGVDPNTFMTPDGKVNGSIFSNAAMQKLLEDPQNFKIYQESDAQGKSKLWTLWGGIGPAPDSFVNGPYRPPMPAGTVNNMYGLPLKVSAYEIDPLSAIKEIASTAESLRANGYDPDGLISAIQQSASSPQFYMNLALKQGKAQLMSAQYQKDVQDAATSYLHGQLYSAQTDRTKFDTNVLDPANAAHLNAETTSLIPSEVTANYAKASQASAEAKKLNLAVKDQIQADTTALAKGLVPGITPDKLQGFMQSAMTTVGKATQAKNAAVTNFSNALKALGIDTSGLPGNGLNASPQEIAQWLNTQPAIVQHAIRPMLQTLQQANQNLYIANRINARINHYNTSTPPGPPADYNPPPALLKDLQTRPGWKPVMHNGQWGAIDDHGNFQPWVPPSQ